MVNAELIEGGEMKIIKYVVLGIGFFLIGAYFFFNDKPDENTEELARKLVLPENVTDEERGLFLIATSYMITNECSKMLGYQESIESMEVQHVTGEYVYDWAKERYGWTDLYIFRPKIKDAPQIGLSDAKGHTLHIVLGIGKRSGIYKYKDVGLEICGFGPTRFIDAPDAKAIFETAMAK